MHNCNISLIEEPMDRPRRRGPRALWGEPRVLLSLGDGKRNGRGAEGIGPVHREQANGDHGKGFGAKTIPYRTAGDSTEEGEGDQDTGGKPGRGRNADRRRMESERHSVREREECEKR